MERATVAYRIRGVSRINVFSEGRFPAFKGRLPSALRGGSLRVRQSSARKTSMRQGRIVGAVY